MALFNAILLLLHLSLALFMMGSFSLHTNAYFDPVDLSKPSFFNARKDEYFKIGSMFHSTTGVPNYASADGIQETLALVCGIDYVNAHLGILPNVTIVYEARRSQTFDTFTTSTCISYLRLRDVPIILGKIVYFI